MYCSYCGMEISDPTQNICENCGTELLMKEISKDVKKDTSLRENNNAEKYILRRNRWHCC